MQNYPLPTAVPVPPPKAPNAGGAYEYGTAPPLSAYPSFSKPNALNARQIEQLKSQGFSSGLIDIVSQAKNYFPVRFWIVDNSGSMNKTDGNRLLPTKNNDHVRMVQCTRWKEIQETVEYHSQMAALLQAHTTFRLLNNPGGAAGPQTFSIADKGEDLDVIQSDLTLARNTMQQTTPSGVTPLTDHLNSIRDMLMAQAHELRQEGKKVALILATDGLPTNEMGIGGFEEQERFTQAMRSFEGLPCWIVVRLCTDDDDVVEFYNNLDNQLELSIEVLDDYTSEAKEVHKENSWLNYTLAMHRMREMGIPNRLFDLLDERRFTKSELRDFCILLFGAGAFDGVPEPEVDWYGFMKELEVILKKEQKQWNPIKQKAKPLLDLKEMNRLYGDASCSIM
uniref:VWFA domain-containing protein n=1 Tax=Chaetoceros debilis TaxID=122233 RepID=A0A7S3Q6U1_9STRA|mmetsp:Transcript_4337/g.6103  ORF Transcript_4337/g.6103 Transcript_4337/m.6103 type:complete len:394 (+) Transcript_4337:180-1361(+)